LSILAPYTLDIRATGFQVSPSTALPWRRPVGAPISFLTWLRFAVGQHPFGAALLQTDSSTISNDGNRSSSKNKPLTAVVANLDRTHPRAGFGTKAVLREQGAVSLSTGQRAMRTISPLMALAAISESALPYARSVRLWSRSRPRANWRNKFSCFIHSGRVGGISSRRGITRLQFGRCRGAQITILTPPGANQFHTGALRFLPHSALDASDWFAKSQPLHLRAPPSERLLGGVLGGPLRHKNFLLLLLRRPAVRQPHILLSTDVPLFQYPTPPHRSSREARTAPYLNAFPLPKARHIGFGYARSSRPIPDASTLDATSLRVTTLSSRLSVFWRATTTRRRTTVSRIYAL